MLHRQLLFERVLPIAILALAAVSVPWLVMSPEGLPRLDRLQVERAEVDEEVSKLSQEIHELRAEVKRIKQDPTAVERVARDELGLVRQTEVVYQFSK